MPISNTEGEAAWAKFGVIQLQNVLHNQNLSYEGSKMDMIKRLCQNNIDTSLVKPWKAMVLGGKFNFGYNLFHSIRMVIINPITETKLQHSEFLKWCSEAKWFKIHKSRESVCEAVLYFHTIRKGNEAHIALKTALEDQHVKVIHPNFEVWGCHPQQYWKMLSTQTSLDVNPLTYDELIAPRRKHLDKRKHVVIENVPESVNDEDLVKIIPEAKETIVFNYDPESTGIVLLEFDDEQEAEKYQKKNPYVMINKVKCPTALYMKKLQSWYEHFAKEEEELSKSLEAQCELTDEERILKCEIWHVLQGDKREIINRVDLNAIEKLQEHIRLHEEQRPIKCLISSDTKRRQEYHLDINDDPTLVITTVNRMVKASHDIKPVKPAVERKYKTGESSEKERQAKKAEKQRKREAEKEASEPQPKRPINTVSRYKNLSPPITIFDFIPPALAPEYGYTPQQVIAAQQKSQAFAMGAIKPVTTPLPIMLKPKVEIDPSRPLDKLDAFRAGISLSDVNKPKDNTEAEKPTMSVPNSHQDRLAAFRKGMF